MTWQIAVIGAVAVLGVLGLVWIFAGRWVSASKGGAVSKDDLDEATKALRERERIDRKLAKPAPTGLGILASWRARRERAKGKL
jgi:hypothetical protein